MPRHMKFASDGWVTVVPTHGRMPYSVKISLSKYSRLPQSIVAGHGWQSTRRTAHGARMTDLPYMACVEDPTGLFSRLEFMAPDCVRPRLQTI